jgi:serine/threonine-protein kinase RsbW
MDVADNTPVRMVTLTLLADRDYLALARTSAMHVGALLFLPLAQVQDLRLAVDEACSSFLQSMRHAAGDSDADAATADTMEISYDRYPSALHVIVRARAPHDWPERDELGWALLGSLVGDVSVSVEDGIGTLTLVEPLPNSTQPSAAV